MPDYRRAYAPGGMFFFTVVTEGRARFLCQARARRCLKRAFAETRERWPFRIEAIVLLPDHLHTIWSLPEGNTDYSIRWAVLKKTFTNEWLADHGCEQAVSRSRKRNRRRGVWQRRFWEHMIRDPDDFERHCDYIHYNPVHHELAPCPHAWPHSSFERFVRQGHYSDNWGCACTGRVATPPNFAALQETAME